MSSRSDSMRGDEDALLAVLSDGNHPFAALLWLSDAKGFAGGAEPVDIDWLAVIQLAADQAMLPLLGTRILTEMPDDDAHATDRAFVQNYLRQNTHRNLVLVAETLRMLTALEEAGIATIALKGCVLALAAYGNLAARKGGDIDLLVKRADVMTAHRVLERRGYVPHIRLTPAQQSGQLAYDCEWEFINKQRHTVIDLHWDLSGRNCGKSVSLAPLWREQEVSLLCGRQIRTLSPAHLVFVLCVHAAKHHWQRLEWIYTLAAVLRRHPHLLWTRDWEEAASSCTERILNLGLLLADELYETPLPETVRARVRADRGARVLARQAMDWLSKDRTDSRSDHELRKFNAALRTSRRGRAYYWICATMTPTAKDYVIELPPSLHWVYYLVRILRLTGRRFASLQRLLSL